MTWPRPSTSRATGACSRRPSYAEGSASVARLAVGRCARPTRRPATSATVRWAAVPNALRLAITGQFRASEGFTDFTFHDALDLCLECKACKGECPTNVDMARLKAEFLHQYYKKHGLPLRNRVFGHVAQSERRCGLPALAPLVELAAAKRRPSAGLNEALLGIDRRRVPPAFAPRRAGATTRELSAGDPSGPGDSRLPLALLRRHVRELYHEPDLGEAAVDLAAPRGRLASPLGTPADLRCCGRPLISNGLLDQAVDHARHNVDVAPRLGHVSIWRVDRGVRAELPADDQG